MTQLANLYNFNLYFGSFLLACSIFAFLGMIDQSLKFLNSKFNYLIILMLIDSLLEC